MTARPLTSREVRERRGRVLDEREALATLFEPPFGGFSTLVGRTYGPVRELPMAINAATGLPTIADGAVTSAAAEPEPITQQLDLKTHEPKPRGPKA
jgi:hypothetical protein